MRVTPFALVVALGVVELGGCGARTGAANSGGAGGVAAAGGAGGLAASGGAGAAGGAGGTGAFGGDPCRTPEGVRLCGGSAAACGWVGPDDCPGGGCARPFDRLLGGEAVAGVCFSDLPDNGSRACFKCRDGEVCVERAPGELVCVPESVCAGLWNLGARGVCRYADLASYDGRPLPVLSQCPSSDPLSILCGGPCPECLGEIQPICTGRSPDHPQGFCADAFGPDLKWCALGDSGYIKKCPFESSLCGIFRVAPADQPVARTYGHCFYLETCKQLSKDLPGGIDCYDGDGKLVTGGGSK